MESLLTPHAEIPHALEPLRESFEFDDMEAAVKAAFMGVFEDLIRTRFDRVNKYGIAHRDDTTTVERFTKQDGIAVYRENSDVYLRELFRAWKARNPRRGLSFLKHYMQMMFPNKWECTQLWHLTNGSYPNATLPSELPGGSYLTSRVAISIADPTISDTLLLSKISPALRSVIAAKFVLLIRSHSEFAGNLVIGATMIATNTVVYSGTAA